MIQLIVNRLESALMSAKSITQPLGSGASTAHTKAHQKGVPVQASALVALRERWAGGELPQSEIPCKFPCALPGRRRRVKPVITAFSDAV